DLAARVHRDPLHPHVHGRAGTDHAQEPGGPGGESACGNGAFGIHRDDRVLGGGREPHAVHDRAAEPGQLGGGLGGVDRVVVAGDGGEGVHGARGGHGDVATTASRGVGGRVGDRTGRPRRIGELTRAV